MHDSEALKNAARAVEAALPDNHGFILFVAPFSSGPSVMRYIASINRQDAILLLKEWLIKAGGEEEWMKHIR